MDTKLAKEIIDTLTKYDSHGDPFEAVSDWDKGHLESIALRHNAKFLNKVQADIYATRSSKNLEQLCGLMAASWGTRSEAEGLKYILAHIDPEEFETEEEAYFAALHELGHQILGHKSIKDREGAAPEWMVNQEIEAWQWAVAHANRFPSDKTICFMMDAISTYSDPTESFSSMAFDKLNTDFTEELLIKAVERAIEFKQQQKGTPK